MFQSSGCIYPPIISHRRLRPILPHPKRESPFRPFLQENLGLCRPKLLHVSDFIAHSNLHHREHQHDTFGNWILFFWIRPFLKSESHLQRVTFLITWRNGVNPLNISPLLKKSPKLDLISFFKSCNFYVNNRGEIVLQNGFLREECNCQNVTLRTLLSNAYDADLRFGDCLFLEGEHFPELMKDLEGHQAVQSLSLKWQERECQTRKDSTSGQVCIWQTCVTMPKFSYNGESYCQGWTRLSSPDSDTNTGHEQSGVQHSPSPWLVRIKLPRIWQQLPRRRHSSLSQSIPGVCSPSSRPIGLKQQARAPSSWAALPSHFLLRHIGYKAESCRNAVAAYVGGQNRTWLAGN